MDAARIAELRKLAKTEAPMPATRIPDRELLELLDLAEMGMRTMPKTAMNIAKRHARQRQR